MAVNANNGQQTTAPTTVLFPGPGEIWDKNLVCDPVGVAFSNDGIKWDKFPYPILQNADSFPQGAYGFGEQTVFSSDGKQGVWMFVINSSK